MATIGTLSGLRTIRAKLGSSMETPRKSAPPTPRASATFGRQNPARLMATEKRTVASVMKMLGAVRKLMTCLIASTAAMAIGLLHRTGDAAVLPHAPEVDGHQDAGDERDADAVQDVEAQQRPPSDEASAQQGEARVG